MGILSIYFVMSYIFLSALHFGGPCPLAVMTSGHPGAGSNRLQQARLIGNKGFPASQIGGLTNGPPNEIATPNGVLTPTLRTTGIMFQELN